MRDLKLTRYSAPAVITCLAALAALAACGPATATDDGFQRSFGRVSQASSSSTAEAASVQFNSLTAMVGDTLTGEYTFFDSAGLTEQGSVYEWDWVTSDSYGDPVYTPIPGATEVTYRPVESGYLRFCVTPGDANGLGTQVCTNATASVYQALAYSGSSESGTSTRVMLRQGCNNMPAGTQSVTVYAPLYVKAELRVYSDSGCGSAPYYGSQYAIGAAKTLSFSPGGNPIGSIDLSWATDTASASNVAISGTVMLGSTITGSYTFSDSAGLVELGTSFQWETSSGSPIAGATGLSYQLIKQEAVQFCVTPADAMGAGVKVCSAATAVPVDGASVSNVKITPSSSPVIPGVTLTSSYTFSDALGLPDNSFSEWFTVVGSTMTSVGYGSTYVPQQSEHIKVCVTPRDAYGEGQQVCTSIAVVGLTFYSGESQTGSSHSVITSNGACIDVSSLGLSFTPVSLALWGTTYDKTTMTMYTGSGCTGLEYVRTAGAGTVHNINLDTVGIGSNFASYLITW